MKLDLYENETVEFKRELNDKLEKTVVAFLNSRGGSLYVGIDDDGTVRGFPLEEVDYIQNLIKSRIKEHVSPSTIGLFQIYVENGEDDSFYLRIIVAEGNEKPYYLSEKGMTPRGVYFRVGSSNEMAPQSRIDSMFMRKRPRTLANLPSPVSNLSFDSLSRRYAKIGITLTPSFMRQNRLLDEDGNFTLLAYLLSEENSLEFSVGKFSGTDAVHLEQLETIGGQSLIDTVFDIQRILKTFNPTYARVTESKRIEERAYDPIALHEASVNAIVHGDYSRLTTPMWRFFDDRLEIISVGGLPDGVNEEEFLEGYRSPRNPLLMKIFKDLRLVEEMGTGIARILSRYEKSVFSFSENFIKVSLPARKGITPYTGVDSYKGGEPTIDDRRGAIVNLISGTPSLTQEDIADRLGVSRFTIMRDLKHLIDEGVVHREGSRKFGRWLIDLERARAYVPGLE